MSTPRALLLVVLPLLGGTAVLTGCGVEQDSACEQFVRCARYYNTTFELAEPNVSAYDADGSCWQDSEVADVCRTQCLDGVAARRAALVAADEDPMDCGEGSAT